MKCLLLLITLFIIRPAVKAQNFCIDSSTHVQFRSLAGDIVRIEKTILTKDSSKISIGSIIDKFSQIRSFVCKINNHQEVLWFKKFTAPFASGQTEFESLLETSNGNIFITTQSVQSDNQPYFLLVLDPKGNMITQKKIGFSNIPGLGNRLVRVPCLSKFGNDSVLVVYYAQPALGSEGELLTLCTMNNVGNEGQAFTFNAPVATIRQSYFNKCRITGDSIELFGATQFWNGCVANSLENPAFCRVQINWKTKQVISKKIYCSPLQGDGYLYFNSQYDEFPGNNGRHNIFLQANGHVIFTRAYMGLEYTGNDTINRLFSISEFDRNFEPLQSQYLTVVNQFKKDNYYELFIDSFNNRHIHIHDKPQNRLFYAVGTNASKFLLQKTVSFVRSIRNGRTSRQNFIEPSFYTSFNTVSGDGQYSYLDNYTILDRDTAQTCFGANTDLLFYKPASISSINWLGNFTVQRAVIESSATNFTLSDYPLERSLVCNIVKRCDTLKINAPHIVCDLSAVVKITAYKNVLCPGPVNFGFDTSAVSSYSQVDDTTLLVNFNKSWKGTIYATASTCKMLRDSVLINVAAPATNFNLGQDIVFCKGKTYILRAPSGFNSYRWQNGNQDSVFVAKGPGSYFVTTEDECGRTYSDTINIQEKILPLFAGKDTVICKSEKLMLSATPGYKNYVWRPTYDISETTGSSVFVSPQMTTSYTVSAEVFADCIITDTVLVSTTDCPQAFWVPTAFTPNKDGKNEWFKPLITGALASYQFTIYNRWGENVFTTTDRYQGWNGNIKEKKQSQTVFVWICTFRFINGKTQVRRGTVMVIR